MVNLNQLRFFREVARQNSFSKAAEICCVTQPTLSNAIAALESLVDGKLFNRNTRHVSLTAYGQHLLPQAKAVLTAHDEFLEAVKAFKNPQHKLLRIGLSPLVDMSLVAEVLQPFKDEHPDVEVFFKECFLDDLSQRMDEETVDLAITPKRDKPIHFSSLALYSEPLYFLPCHSGSSRLPENSTATITDIANETIITTGDGCGLRDAIRKLFQEADENLQEYRGQAVSYKIVEDWAGLGIGAGILPLSKLSASKPQAHPLLRQKDLEASIHFEVSYSRNVEQARHVKEFIDYLANVAPRLIQGRAA